MGKLTAADDSARRVWEVAELILAAIRGLDSVQTGVGPARFRCHRRIRLPRVVASERCLRGGQSTAPSFERCTISRLPMRMVTRHGRLLQPAPLCAAHSGHFLVTAAVFFWKMNAGMGDAVFGPFYQVLRATWRTLRVLSQADQRGVGPLEPRFPARGNVGFRRSSAHGDRGGISPLELGQRATVLAFAAKFRPANGRRTIRGCRNRFRGSARYATRSQENSAGWGRLRLRGSGGGARCDPAGLRLDSGA